MVKIEKKASKIIKPNLREEYRNFINTKKYNLSFQYIPKFLTQINHDIVVEEGKIELRNKKIKNLHPLHPMAIKIKTYNKNSNDKIKKLKERKKQLIELNEKSKLPLTQISPDILRIPMKKETEEKNEN